MDLGIKKIHLFLTKPSTFETLLKGSAASSAAASRGQKTPASPTVPGSSQLQTRSGQARWSRPRRPMLFNYGG
ncbi:unnamed protein product [Tetraodon nigroviridis]|uniref:(spotted green pufferfish) hypothetical protein n=1 Tax=Tetraodon nigroviridis TaxID=99883 RepID=Q4SHK3_TETNG|nr:unnamed protein product [Tetraodon nigroviridis]